ASLRRGRDKVVDEVDDLGAGSPVVVGVFRMTGPGAALRDGMRRVNRSPAILLGVWILTVAVSLPLALAVRGLVEQHLGSSLAADTAVSGVNYEWWQEFSDQAAGLGITFRPTIIGFGAVLDNLSGFLDNQHRPVVIVGAAAAYIVIWIFFAGGIIDRFARDRATRAHGFFAVSGTFFFRDFVLFVLAVAVYAAIAPGAGSGGLSVWVGFAIGQLYILARLWVKLVFWASETSLFQARLAHAGYVAAPKPVWPESPTAEAITRS